MTAPTLDRDHGVALLREMLRIRRFEERCAELYSASKIRGFLHLYIGEEAIAVGVMQALEPEDAVLATYREHGHALARGVSAAAIIAEAFAAVELAPDKRELVGIERTSSACAGVTPLVTLLPFAALVRSP